VDSKDPDAHLLDSVGRRIEELREQAGITQAEAAERAAMTLTNYQRIEAGMQNLTLRTLGKLARVLGCSVAAFFEVPASPRARPGRPKRRAQ
jgi:transcriptional regulator with XRE-family HTH domain